MTTTLENLIVSTIDSVVGAPIILGILFIGFFAIFLMLQNTRIDGKVVIMIPVLFMAGAFLNVMPFIAIIVAGAAIAYGLAKFNRS